MSILAGSALGKALGGAVTTVLDSLFPDPVKRAEAQLALLTLEQQGRFKAIEADLQMAQNQADINKAEAGSTDKFVTRWRPFIGWVCGAAFAWHFFLLPFLLVLLPLFVPGIQVPEVKLNMESLMTLLLAMLGLGGYRTFEKVNGKA